MTKYRMNRFHIAPLVVIGGTVNRVIDPIYTALAPRAYVNGWNGGNGWKGRWG